MYAHTDDKCFLLVYYVQKDAWGRIVSENTIWSHLVLFDKTDSAKDRTNQVGLTAEATISILKTIVAKYKKILT